MTSKGFDIVIGYHSSDLDFVKRLAEKFKKSNMTVWFSSKESSASQTSNAILGCKVYVPVMTEVSAPHKSMQEQLSLAYISNSAIYPLSKIRYRFLSPKLGGGARLMLAKINWCFVFNMEEFDSKTDTLIKCIRKDLDNMAAEIKTDVSSGFYRTHGLTYQHVPTEMGQDGFDEPQKGDLDIPSIKGDAHFWDRHFKGMTEVPWKDFRNCFLKDYGSKIEEQLAEEELVDETTTDKKELVVHLMQKDIFKQNKLATHFRYIKFSKELKPHSFFIRVEEYLLAYISLKKVFSMDSEFRVPTIQSLGQYSFPAIVEGLTDMLEDDDPNIRAVAAIALAHAGKEKASTVDKLIPLTEDVDRLVRESACLSLGFLRSTRAVPIIMDRWRNDPISTVREAAELALSKLDTADAKRCMKVTQVLSSEMKALKPKEAV